MLPKRCSQCGFVFEAGPLEIFAACPRCGGTGWPDAEAASSRGLGPRPLRMLLPILGPLAAIVAYQYFGPFAMIAVVGIALILFFRRS